MAHEVVAVDRSEHRAVYVQLIQHHPLSEQRLCGAQMRYLFRSAQGWLGACAFLAYQVLNDIAPRVPETCLVSIGDREADLFELFARAREPESPRLLVRACQGRRRKVSTETGRLPLWKHVQALPVAGHTAVDTPRRGQNNARTVLLSVRFGPARIDPPKDKAATAGTADAPIDLWAVHLFEEDPPERRIDPLVATSLSPAKKFSA